MKFGKVSLNVKLLANISEQEFYKLVVGSLTTDKRDEWVRFSKEAEKYKDKGHKPKDLVN